MRYANYIRKNFKEARWDDRYINPAIHQLEHINPLKMNIEHIVFFKPVTQRAYNRGDRDVTFDQRSTSW